MLITLSSIINTFFLSNLLILVLIMLLSLRVLTRYINTYTIITCFFVLMIRLLFPLEFYFTRAIPVNRFIPQIYVFISKTIINIGNINFKLVQFFAFLWFIISVLLICNTFRHYAMTRNNLTKLEEIKDPKIIEIYNKLNNSYKKNNVFRLVYSPSLQSPFVFGIKEPIIVLPKIELTDKELNYIFKHELCHYYKKHLHIKILCELISNIYFWNPLIYIMKLQISKSLEIYVDSTLTSTVAEMEKIEYIECLIKIAKLQYFRNINRPYVAGFSILSISLTDRTRKIMEPSFSPKQPLYSNLFLSLVISVILFSYLFIYEPYALTDYVQQNTFILDKSNSFYIKNNDDTFDLYIENVYVTTLDGKLDSKIPIKEIINEKN